MFNQLIELWRDFVSYFSVCFWLLWESEPFWNIKSAMKKLKTPDEIRMLARVEKYALRKWPNQKKSSRGLRIEYLDSPFYYEGLLWAKLSVRAHLKMTDGPDSAQILDFVMNCLVEYKRNRQTSPEFITFDTSFKPFIIDAANASGYGIVNMKTLTRAQILNIQNIARHLEFCGLIYFHEERNETNLPRKHKLFQPTRTFTKSFASLKILKFMT